MFFVTSSTRLIRRVAQLGYGQLGIRIIDCLHQQYRITPYNGIVHLYGNNALIYFLAKYAHEPAPIRHLVTVAF